MAIRVDREIFDPGAGGTTGGGGVRFYDDGRAQPPWQPRPFSTKEEFNVSYALQLMATPAEVIREIRPPMINEPFPPMFGYDSTQLTIEEVLDTGRWGPQQRSWVSGAPAVRRANTHDQMWAGTARNTTDPSLNPGG